MPTEHAISLLNDILQYDSVQVKLCSDCHRPLTDASHRASSQHHPSQASDTLSVCSPCREKRAHRSTQVAQPPTPSASNVIGIDVEGSECCDMDVDNSSSERASVDSIAQTNHDRPPPSAQDLQTSPSSSHAKSEYSPGTPPASQRTQRWSSSTSQAQGGSHEPSRPTPTGAKPVMEPPSPSQSLISSSRPPSLPVFSPDPLADITRIRVRSHSYGCLYPGATFQGTQKSGKNSYDVTVTIVVSSR